MPRQIDIIPAMRPWLARFSFSFFIVAAVLAWESYKGMRGDLGPISQWRIVLFMIAAVLSFVMGVSGVRERHRPRNDDDGTS